MREYAPADVVAARKRKTGRRLTAAGAVAAAAGLFGLVFTQLLDLVWLDPIAHVVGPLAVLCLVAGGVAFVTGFNLIRSAGQTAGRG